MINILIKQFGNIEVDGDIKLLVKREFSLNSKTSLEFLNSENEVIFKVHYFTLFNLNIKIDYHDIKEEVSFFEKKMWIGENEFQLQHNWLYWLTGSLCNIYYNEVKIAKISCRNQMASITLTVENFITNKEILTYMLIFLIIRYSDLDGGD